MGKKKREERAEARRAAHVRHERQLAAQRRRRKTIITWSFVAGAVAILALLIYGMIPKPSPYDAFALCLTEAGAAMYGTDWCSSCQAQKRLFGSAFADVEYVNCDYTRACEERGVRGYPTWIFEDGERLVGQQPLAVLAEKTGCALPEVDQ